MGAAVCYASQGSTAAVHFSPKSTSPARLRSTTKENFSASNQCINIKLVFDGIGGARRLRGPMQRCGIGAGCIVRIFHALRHSLHSIATTNYKCTYVYVHMCYC